MNHFARICFALLCAGLALPSRGDEITNKTLRHWVAGPDDAIIASTTADMLAKCHYLHLELDPKLSARFFTNYLNTLDPQHIHFLQTDLDEFEKYRTRLGELTRGGDTTPAYAIYDRYVQRLEERTAYALELLKGEPFDFSADEQMPLSRKAAAPPKDLTEARQLWKQRVRYEYLQEKLNKESRGELARQMLSRFNLPAFALAGRDFNNDIVQFITRRYNRIQRNFREWESDKVLETYLTSLGHVYDPHTDYYDRSDLENFQIQMSLTLFGIGATLMQSDDGYTTITALVPNGPAEKSKKLKVNDRIVAVAQGTNEPVDVVDMPLNHVVDKIRGTKNTEVRLSIIPADAVDLSARVTVLLTRDEIKLVDQQAKASLVEMNGANGQMVRVGVIDLPSFYASFPLLGGRGRPQQKSTTLDVLKLLTKLLKEGAQGIVLDLRHNGGGSLEEAINLTGLFINQGPVVQIRGSDNSGEIRDDSDPAIFYSGPLIVLTSRFSASASEILAAALQDYGRALVVGDKSTHGKGTVQSMSQLAPYLFYQKGFHTNDPAALGALKYTTNMFYRINGTSTQLKGVVPDITLPSTYDYMELLGEGSLDNALSAVPIESVEHDKFNRVQPFLDKLRSLSAARVAGDKDFAYVREDIEQVKKVMGDKSISLNETQRLKEMDENEARQKARQRELKSRKWPNARIFDISLKQTEESGLPAPLVITNGLILNETTTRTASASGKSGVIVTTNLTVSVTETPVPATRSGSVSPDLDSDDESAPKTASPAELLPMDRAHVVEAQRILLDYISLWNANPPLTARSRQN